MLRAIIKIFLRIVLGLAFIISAVLKLFPIEPFELNFIDIGIANWYVAPILSRLVIGTEFFLGALLIAGLGLRKFTLPASFILLLLFTAYLLLLLITGNNGDCGCFGIYIVLTPLESIIKNIGLLSMLWMLWKMTGERKFRWQKVIIIAIVVISIVLPFILNPVEFTYSKTLRPEASNFPLPKELIEKNKYGMPSVDLFNGKHIVSFMTLTCPHCKQVALKIHVIQKRHPEISFFIFLNGNDQYLDDFFTLTKSDNIPHLKMNSEPFSKLTGGTWPQIWWVENGIVVKKSVYYTLNEDELLTWWNQH